MHIAVIGTGYVGLVSGACFAEFGVDVTCVDVDKSKIDGLLNGRIPIYEPGLDKIVSKNSKDGRLRFTTDLRSAVESAEVVFLAVGTPPKEDGSPDMSFYRQAAKDVAGSLNGYKVIVTKSTVPVGTGKWLRDFVTSNVKPGIEFGVASNPEFLREGAAIEDFMHPNRVVIGSDDPRAIEVMKELYRPLYLIETPIVITSLEAAELIKYAANAFLATKITFINEIANLCDAIGCDVHDVAKGMGMDNRIGRKFLHPGPGYGGSCFPKDTSALTTIGDEFGVETRIVDAVIEANKLQRKAMIPKIESLVGDLAGKRIAVLGLSFKPETDDMRESPAIDIIREMTEKGATVKAFDPVAMDEARHCLAAIEYASDEYDAIDGADALVIITEWNQFRALDMNRVKSLLKSPKVADLRNIYEPEDMRELGFEYIGVGPLVEEMSFTPKVIVTGGAGFIGSNLADSLARQGARVTIIDNFITGFRENLDEIRGDFDFVQGDINDDAVLKSTLQDVDVIYHQAALPSVPRSVDDPAETHQACVNGTLNLLIKAKNAGVRRFVYAASSSAYGDQPTLPKIETMRADPLSPYAVAKLTGEHYCRSFYKVYGLETVSLRYFNVFGPRQNPASMYSGVISRFVDSLMTGEQPVIYGDGEHSRDFTYIDNVVDANIKAAETTLGIGETINVANGERITLNNLLETLKKITGKTDADARHEAPRAGDVRDSQADNSRAVEWLGYRKLVGLEEGLERTIDWWKNSRFAK